MTRPRTAPCFIRPDEASAESDTRTGPTDNSLIKRSVMKNRLIWLLLSLLGMAAGCSSNDKLIPVEYGCPHADYEIKGRVTDPDGNPIRAIEITTDELPVAYSSATGDYRLKGTAFPGDMRIRFTDTDGPDNGGSFAERRRPGGYGKRCSAVPPRCRCSGPTGIPGIAWEFAGCGG